MAEVKLSILIVNWNGARFLESCLASISAKVTGSYEVVLVDNGSTDGSEARAVEQFPWVKLVPAGENLGFSKGNNLAASHATGDVLLLLNYDTVLQLDPMPLAEAVLADPQVGCLGAAMGNGDGVRVGNCGHFPSPIRLLLFASLFWFPFQGKYRSNQLEAQIVDWVEGSWFLMRRKLWQELGGFDPGIFMYGEDVELCRRISDRGLKVLHKPELAYLHSTGWSAHRLPNQYAGFRRYHRTHSGSLERALADAILFAGLQLRLVCYWFLARMTKQPRFLIKTAALVQVNRLWSRLIEPGFRAPKS